jgi:hypothetical protein
MKHVHSAAVMKTQLRSPVCHSANARGRIRFYCQAHAGECTGVTDDVNLLTVKPRRAHSAGTRQLRRWMKVPQLHANLPALSSPHVCAGTCRNPQLSGSPQRAAQVEGPMRYQ